MRFYTDAPAWGTTPSSPVLSLLPSHFNPRSRVGNDTADSINSVQLGISIHVPAWGTTKYYNKLKTEADISIHVPAWGTTVYVYTYIQTIKFQSTFPRGERLHIYCIIITTTHFNPRSRVGNDILSLSSHCEPDISIHVPAWGTTRLIHQHTKRLEFQSTFPRGERQL